MERRKWFRLVAVAVAVLLAGSAKFQADTFGSPVRYAQDKIAWARFDYEMAGAYRDLDQVIMKLFTFRGPSTNCRVATTHRFRGFQPTETRKKGIASRLDEAFLPTDTGC